MKKLLLAAAVVLLALPAYAQNTTKGGVQRLDLDSITLDGTEVTATGAELNILDGVTATATEINQATDISANSEIVTSANTITTSECGSLFFISSTTGFASTLPSPTRGCRLDFVISTDSTGTNHTVITTGAETIKGFTLNITGNAGSGSTAADTVSFVSTSALASDSLGLKSDGTSWHAIGFSSASGAITFSSAI